MNKLWLLLKVELRETFLPAPKSTNTSGTSRRKFASSSGAGYLFGLIIACVLIAAIFGVFMWGVAVILSQMGGLELLPMMGIVGSSISVLITTVYKTNGLLFGFRDYDLVNALPFSTRDIIFCRFSLIYLWNMPFTVCIMLPAGIIYSIFAQSTGAFWLIYIIEMLLVPLVPCVVAAIIGLLIGLIARRFKKNGIAGTVLTVAFMVLWMLFCMNLNDENMAQFAAMAPMVTRMLGQVYPPALWATQACCNLNIGMFALFCGISIGAFALFVGIVSRHFRAINAALTSSHIVANYKMSALRGQSVHKALLTRERKRLLGSSTYFMNSCVGDVLYIVMAAIVLFAGTAALFDSDIPTDEGAGILSNMPVHAVAIIAMFFCLFTAMSSTTVSSISLEGKQLWIIKTLPVSTGDVLRSKLTLNVWIVGIATLIGGTILWIAFPDAGLYNLFFYVAPFTYGLFAALLGLRLNLKYPKLDWVNEIVPVKQGKAVMILTFSDMGICIGSFVLTMFLGDIAAIILICIMLVMCMLLYRTLRTKGVQEFDSLSG